MQTGIGFQELISYTSVPDYYKQLSNYDEILKKVEFSADRIYVSMSRVNMFAQSSSKAIEGVGEVLKNLIMLFMVYSFYENNVSSYALMTVTILLPLYFSSVSSMVSSSISRKNYEIAKNLNLDIISNAENEMGKELGDIESLKLSVDKVCIADKTIKFTANETLKKGDIVQVQGESGSGKSTFAKTLVKFRNINGVEINGTSIADISGSYLRDKVEYVSQNIPIIKGTLRDNLCFGKNIQGIEDKYFLENPLLVSVLKDKKLDDEIMEGGANLSGGEKQKIALTRALLSKPEILILDEVCSNTDQDTSFEIYNILKKEKNNRITMIITHDTLPENFVDIVIN